MKLRIPFLFAALALILTACGPASSPSPSASAASAPPSESAVSPTPPADWMRPPYRAMCSMETLYTMPDTLSAEDIEALIQDMDEALYYLLTHLPAAEDELYQADFSRTSDAVLLWSALLDLIRHTVPEAAEADGEAAVPETVLLSAYRQYFQADGSELPAIPASLNGSVRLEDGVCRFTVPESLYPKVELTWATDDTDDAGIPIIQIFAESVFDVDEEVYYAELRLRRNPSGQYTLQMAHNAYERVEIDAEHIIFNGQATVYAAESFTLLENTPDRAVFENPDGVSIELTLEALEGDLETMRLTEAESVENEVGRFTNEAAGEYGFISQRDGVMQYRAVIQTAEDQIVRLRTDIPFEWVTTYFYLAESLLEPFGGEEWPPDLYDDVYELAEGI